MSDTRPDISTGDTSPASPDVPGRDAPVARRPEAAVVRGLEEALTAADAPMRTRDLSCFFSKHHAVDSVSLDFAANSVTAIIGPSGCGKSTYIRSLNRMHELVPNASTRGEVLLNGQDIYQRSADPVAVRQSIGMVFQRPNPFPTKSIADNILAGPRFTRMKLSRSDRDDLVEHTLRGAGLWGEVKNRLHAPAGGLSGGQQQRLCIARALSVEPDVLLMDEPCSALDPQSTLRIEDLIHELKQRLTIVIVTHNMQQAARVSDRTAFFTITNEGEPGRLIETGPTSKIFSAPDDPQTEAYVAGRFG